MSDSDVQPAEPIRYRLWNPNAAAIWGLLLSSAFGAYLHAANWRALGKPERAATNMWWLAGTVAFAIFNLITLFLPESKVLDSAFRYGGIGLLVGWYSTEGRSQIRYVKDVLGNSYDKKRWGVPLLAGFAGVGKYLAVIVFIAVATYIPEPNELAAEVTPMILEEWQKHPELQPSIQNVSLVHKGGMVYTGFVDTTLAGQKKRLPLEVIFGDDTISWKLKPGAEE